MRRRDLNKASTNFSHGPDFDPKTGFIIKYTECSLKDYSSTSNDASITSYFDKIEDVFVDYCHDSEVVVGAVAWLTNPRILTALSRPQRVAIVVQKEDFLRRDVDVLEYPRWVNTLHDLYEKLHCFYPGAFLETYPGQQEFNPEYNAAVQHWLFDASGDFQKYGPSIRCMGYGRDESGKESPRMHHKFLVFGRMAVGLVMEPHCVITGSFNLTKNATRSRENIVVIRDKAICHSYLSEWAQLWCMSETLNWSSAEPSPDLMYMGT